MHGQHTATLRVLHVLSGDLWAGAEVMAHTLLRELAHNSAFDLRVALLNEGVLAGKVRAEGIATHVFDEQRMNSLSILRGLTEFCQSFRPHIVHTHRKKENVLGALAARRAGARSLRTVHGFTEFPKPGLDPGKHLSRWLDVAVGRYLQDRIVAVSEDLRSRLHGTFGAERLAVVENGIDLAAVRAAGAEPATLPGAAGRRRIGIVARLVPVKRHDRFLDAAASLLDGGRDDCEFYIAGDGPERRALEARIGSMPHAGRVHLLGFRADILPVVAALDAVVVCSDHEGIPMNVLEAAALGVPIVSVPLPSIEGIIRSGARGIVAGDCSGPALAGALRDLLDGTVPAGEALDSSWRYSAERMAARYADLYATLRAD